MKAQFINPFLMAIMDVFQQMLGLEIERGALELKEDFIEGKDANVLIGVIGALSGAVVYSFPRFTALEIVKSMAGMEMNDLDTFVTSALGELGNIISGNAITYLAQAGYQCEIPPPQIILGENKSISLAAPKYFLVPINTRSGGLTISVALKEKSSAGDK